MDRYGLHLVSSKGIYWTDIALEEEFGEYAAMTVKGYGPGMKIYLVRRSSGEIVVLNASLKHK